MQSMVVYYSYTGCTELVARTLAEAIQARAVPIEDLAKPSKFKAYVFGSIAAIRGKAWPIKPCPADLAGCGRVFVGSPVWAGMPAPAFNAFVEQTDFNGKTVVVFATMAGGAQDTALKAMTEKITAKGGKVVDSFYVKTGKTVGEALIRRTREIIGKYIQPPE